MISSACWRNAGLILKNKKKNYHAFMRLIPLRGRDLPCTESSGVLLVLINDQSKRMILINRVTSVWITSTFTCISFHLLFRSPLLLVLFPKNAQIVFISQQFSQGDFQYWSWLNNIISKEEEKKKEKKRRRRRRRRRREAGVCLFQLPNSLAANVSSVSLSSAEFTKNSVTRVMS